MTLHQGDCVHLVTDLALSAGFPNGENPSTWTIESHAGQSAPRPGDTSPSQETLYQVIGVDIPGDRCWVRRWPLARHGSPVFEVSIAQVELPHRPHSQGCPSRS